MKFTAAFAALFSSFGLLVAANPITVEDHHVAFSLSFGEEGGSDRKLGVFEDEKNRQLANVASTVDFGPGGFCNTCDEVNYGCNNEFFPAWNDGIRTFTDPTTPDFILCNLKVTVYGSAENSQVDVLLNGNSIGTSSALGGDLVCDSCETAEIPTLFYSDLLSFYNKGGENTIQVVTDERICVDRVELDFTDCTQSLQDCLAANPCTLADGACAQELEALQQSNIAAGGDSCPSEAPSGAPSSSPTLSSCSDTCMDGDGNEGIAICTIHDDHLHNRCDTSGTSLIPGVTTDTIDGREIYSCGCCDLTVPDTTDFTEVKRSKKGAHCDAEYDVVRKLSAGGMKKNQSKNSRIRRMAPL